MEKRLGIGIYNLLSFPRREPVLCIIILLSLALCLFTLAKVNAEVGRLAVQYNDFIKDYCVCAGHLPINTTIKIPVVNISGWGK